jgi:hypothetical protein
MSPTRLVAKICFSSAARRLFIHLLKNPRTFVAAALRHFMPAPICPESKPPTK